MKKDTFSSGTAGNYQELRDTQKVFDQVDKSIMDHYVKYTGLSTRMIRSKLLNHKDNYLSAEEAVKYGLFDISMGLKGLFQEIQLTQE
jgi:ATP-dependent protease ClpP protease subunit